MPEDSIIATRMGGGLECCANGLVMEEKLEVVGYFE